MPRSTWIPPAIAVVTVALAWLFFRRETPGNAPAPPVTASARPAPSSSAAPGAATEGAEIAPEETRVADDDSFKLLVFPVPLAGARFDVVDLPMARDLDRVLAEKRASLVVNAGFFDPAQAPEGLVIAGGAVRSPLSATLGGGVIHVSGGRAALAAAEGFAAPPGTTFAIQARPRLVVDGKSNIVKDDGREAERTALCVRDGGRTIEVVVARGDAAGRGPTLALLADMLVSRGCSAALNLDGGPSTGVAWRQGETAHARLPRGTIRQAIVIHMPHE
jgi:uncharacterized protein YigE (DUF2233 family)